MNFTDVTLTLEPESLLPSTAAARGGKERGETEAEEKWESLPP